MTPTTDRAAEARANEAATRSLYWSVRRELWENRSIYVGPIVAAGVVLIGFLISVTHQMGTLRAVAALEPAKQAVALIQRLGFAGLPLLIVGFLVAVFYCLEALHGERRDRSILFWKSLPVSDLTTVLSKALVVLAVLPLVLFGVMVVLQLVMMLLSFAILMPRGLDVAALWDRLPLLRSVGLLLYLLVTATLWHAPLYAWLLLVSGWARRMTFLWAVLPPLALCVVERVAFGTTYLFRMFAGRVAGSFQHAFTVSGDMHDGLLGMPHADPMKFLTTPAVWIGLAVTVAFIALAVRQRRYREPI